MKSVFFVLLCSSLIHSVEDASFGRRNPITPTLTAALALYEVRKGITLLDRFKYWLVDNDEQDFSMATLNVFRNNLFELKRCMFSQPTPFCNECDRLLNRLEVLRGAFSQIDAMDVSED